MPRTFMPFLVHANGHYDAVINTNIHSFLSDHSHCFKTYHSKKSKATAISFSEKTAQGTLECNSFFLGLAARFQASRKTQTVLRLSTIISRLKDPSALRYRSMKLSCSSRKTRLKPTFDELLHHLRQQRSKQEPCPNGGPARTLFWPRWQMWPANRG